LNSRLKELEAERTRLTAELDAAPEEKVRLSPNLARILSKCCGIRSTAARRSS
jgi:hypothetical protein